MSNNWLCMIEWFLKPRTITRNIELQVSNEWFLQAGTAYFTTRVTSNKWSADGRN